MKRNVTTEGRKGLHSMSASPCRYMKFGAKGVSGIDMQRDES